jgi:hypothetical protein
VAEEADELPADEADLEDPEEHPAATARAKAATARRQTRLRAGFAGDLWLRLPMTRNIESLPSQIRFCLLPADRTVLLTECNFHVCVVVLADEVRGGTCDDRCPPDLIDIDGDNEDGTYGNFLPVRLEAENDETGGENCRRSAGCCRMPTDRPIFDSVPVPLRAAPYRRENGGRYRS